MRTCIVMCLVLVFLMPVRSSMLTNGCWHCNSLLLIDIVRRLTYDCLLCCWHRCECWIHDIVVVHLMKWCINVLLVYSGRALSRVQRKRRGLVFIDRSRVWSMAWGTCRTWDYSVVGWRSGELQKNNHQCHNDITTLDSALH